MDAGYWGMCDVCAKLLRGGHLGILVCTIIEHLEDKHLQRTGQRLHMDVGTTADVYFMLKQLRSHTRARLN